MPFDTLLALATFAFVTSISPGPSNFMLLASGANFGFLRTVPQILGITVGFTTVLCSVGLGLGAVLTAVPALHLAVKIAGAAYLLYLAWCIAMSRSLGGGDAEKDSAAKTKHPLTFLQSAAFQWINPKAWIAAMTAIAVYAQPGTPVTSLLILGAVIAVVNLPSVSVWAGFGLALRGLLANPQRLKWFNITMGALLAATLGPMLR